MKVATYFFFYTYIGLVLFAGFWGAFINPYFDFRQLFDLNLDDLSNYSKINILSQYRFLRAIEMGFGIFSFYFTKQIFTKREFNTLFLIIMGSGILARLTSLIADGQSNILSMFFMIYEFIALVIIVIYTRNHTLIHANQ
jgi:hypothetical protein